MGNDLRLIHTLTYIIEGSWTRVFVALLFSKPIVLTKMEGDDVLMFRAGNARGNDIADGRMIDYSKFHDTSPRQ